jgi:transcriptional antiterminator NusG
MNAYCLYCKSGSEHNLVKLIKKSFKEHLSENVAIYYPTRLMNQKKKGQWSEVEQPLLPGYIFLFLPQEIALPTFLLTQEKNVYKILRYSDGTMALKEDDRNYAMWLYDHKGYLKPSTVIFEEGQLIKIVDGPLREMEGKIEKVDRRHRRVVVNAMFAGAVRKLNLSINIIDQLKS